MKIPRQDKRGVQRLEVMQIKTVDLEKAPTSGGIGAADNILGMAKINGGVKILLDINGLIGAKEVAYLDKEGSVVPMN